MDHFPLFADLRERPCLVVGGGQVALRKTRLLQSAGARVTIVAPRLCDELGAAADAAQITVRRESFEPAHLEDHVLVIAASDDQACNARVATAAHARGRLCNVVDDPSRCSFIMPAIVDRGTVTIAISTGGRSPTLARWLKARLERLVPERVGELATLARRWRNAVKRRLRDGADRQRFWLSVFSGPIVEDILAGRASDAERGMTRALARAGDEALREGEAYLVGAGPGDAELITLRGARLLSDADVVLHDSLISRSVLELARRDAIFINVGKRAGRHSMKQEDITALLLRLVGEGRRVCRLKGGDPFLFGRGGEEALALSRKGYRFQIVPGVTAAAACGAYAGIPLTHRGVADSVVFVTAHGCEPGHQPDWSALSDARRTVVFYMGVRRLGDIGRGLIVAGRAAKTPVAIIQNGSTREHQTRIVTLGQLADNAVHNIASPAVVVVGEVVRLADSLSWFEPAGSSSQLMLPAGQSTTLDDVSKHRYHTAGQLVARPQ